MIALRSALVGGGFFLATLARAQTAPTPMQILTGVQSPAVASPATVQWQGRTWSFARVDGALVPFDRTTGLVASAEDLPAIAQALAAWKAATLIDRPRLRSLQQLAITSHRRVETLFQASDVLVRGIDGLTNAASNAAANLPVPSGGIGGLIGAGVGMLREGMAAAGISGRALVNEAVRSATGVDLAALEAGIRQIHDETGGILEWSNETTTAIERASVQADLLSRFPVDAAAAGGLVPALRDVGGRSREFQSRVRPIDEHLQQFRGGLEAISRLANLGVISGAAAQIAGVQADLQAVAGNAAQTGGTLEALAAQTDGEARSLAASSGQVLTMRSGALSQQARAVQAALSALQRRPGVRDQALVTVAAQVAAVSSVAAATRGTDFSRSLVASQAAITSTTAFARARGQALASALVRDRQRVAAEQWLGSANVRAASAALGDGNRRLAQGDASGALLSFGRAANALGSASRRARRANMLAAVSGVFLLLLGCYVALAYRGVLPGLALARGPVGSGGGSRL